MCIILWLGVCSSYFDRWRDCSYFSNFKRYRLVRFQPRRLWQPSLYVLYVGEKKHAKVEAHFLQILMEDLKKWTIFISIWENFVNKLKLRLNSETKDALCFLRSYFIKQKEINRISKFVLKLPENRLVVFQTF